MALETGLRLVEKHLRSMKDTLEQDGHVKEGILYRTRCDIRSSEKPGMLQSIGTMLEEIALMKKEFSLGTQEDTDGMHMLGSLTEVWVTLEELRPDALRGFGRLSEASTRRLEPHVLRMLQSYHQLSEALQNSREDQSSLES